MSQKITKNFYFYEFRPKGRQKTWMPSSIFQKGLIVNLAKDLQVVRSAMPRGAWIQITSGVRSAQDYTRLINAGYRPSKTSDHNFGNAVPLKANTVKYKKYGSTYNFSVGAADCVPRNFPVKSLFELAVHLTQEGVCNFGQVIYEKSPKSGAEWVHLGADPSYCFSEEIVRFMKRTQFLVSLDGGKSYQAAPQ